MAATYSTYEQTFSELLSNPWDDTSTRVFIQLLSSSYVYSDAHTRHEDIDDYVVGSRVAVTDRSISNDGALSCSDIIFAAQGTVTASYAVVYLSSGSAVSIYDPLLFYFNLNNSDSLTLTDRDKLSIGTILSWQTDTLSLCTTATTITANEYDTGKRNLLQVPFADEGNVYAAQLVGDGYAFSSSHTTRADVAYFVGAPLVLSGKLNYHTSNYTYLDCDDLDFKAMQGTLDAAYCVIHQMTTNAPLASDKLVACYTLNGGESESLSSPLTLSPCGIMAIQREQ